MKTIRVLAVGLSGAGRGNWQLVRDTPGMALVGGVDVAAKSRKAFAAEVDGPTFNSFEEGLGAVEADATLISTPNAFHGPYSMAAMKAGLDVLVEKPMARSMPEAKRMHRVSQQTGRILMAKQNLRWIPAHMAAAKLLAKGVVGRIRQVDYDFYVYGPGALKGFRRKIPYLLFEDLGIHHFDVLRFLTGAQARSVYAVSWPSVGKPCAPAASAGRAIIEMAGPVTVSYRGEMVSITDATTYLCRFMITGTKGALFLRDGQLLVRDRAAAARGDDPKPIPEKEIQRLCKETFVDAFARAVRTRKPPMTHSGDNLHSLALVFAAMKSAETGKVIRL